MQPFTELIDEAQEMLLDQSRPVQDLIYFIAKLDNEERAAICLAYRILYEEKCQN